MIREQYKGSIKTKLVLIIAIVTIVTTSIGYGGFVYWYMNNQYERALELSKTVGDVIGQNVAKLTLLNDVSAAADITSQLKSFSTLDLMVLYKLDKKPTFQYNIENTTVKVDPFPNNYKNLSVIKNNTLTLYKNANYQDTHLGYVQLNFQVKGILDIIKKDINVLIMIFLFSIFISYLLAIFFAKQFTNPIVKLVSFLEDIENIDLLKNRVFTKEDNEFGKLYDEVNTMLEKLESSNKALKIAAVAFETQNGMAITDSNGVILQINKAFTNITGYEPKEVIGKTPGILKSGLHDDMFYIEMFKTIKEHSYWSGEIINLHKNGKIVNEFLMIQTVLDNNNNIAYYVSSFLDITFQKETEAKLKQKESLLIQQSKMAAMGEMLENIAHQWRQPLSIISTASSGMKLEKEYDISNEENEIKTLETINTAAQHLSQTIDDFRDFFKPNKKKLSFNIEQTYQKTFLIIESKFKNKNIKVVENISDIKLMGFENELKQVLMNILNNAIDALESNQIKEKLVFINIYQDSENAIISIRDNANGIPQNIIDKIFDPYFTTKEQSEGTGIGLHMSYEIVTKHLNGTLEVKNSTYDYNETTFTGANFIIKLPLSIS